MKRRLLGKIAGYITYSTVTINKVYGDIAFINPITITGDGTITYSSNNTTVATINQNTGLVTIVKPGTAIITATVADSTHYSYETKNITYTLNVAKAEGRVSEPPVSATVPYTGNSQQLVTAGSGTGTMMYKLNNGAWSTSIPTAINHDTYTILYKASENDYYTESPVGSLLVTITLSAPDYVAPTAKALVYNGDELELLNAGSTSDGTFYYSTDNSTWSESIPKGTNANTYTVYWKLEGDNNHTSVSSTEVEVTIDKAENSLTATKHDDWTYNGESYALISEATGEGTITYSLNGGEYSSNVPIATNSGTYIVKVKASGNSNYYSKEISYTIVVNKVTPTVTIPTAKVLTYNGSVQILANAGSTTFGTLKYSLDNSTWSTNIPTGTNAGSYTLYYKVDGDSNVNSVDASSINCSINEKEVTATVTLSSTSYTYDGNAKIPTVTVKDESTVIPSSEYTVTYSNNTNAGTATVTITDKTGGNYNVIGSATFTINKAPGSVSISGVSLTYNGNSRSLASVSDNTGIMHYSTDYSNWSTSIPTATNVGSWTIYWYMDASTNYAGIGASTSRYVSSSIGKASLSAPTAYGAESNYPNYATASASGGGGVGSLEWESAQSLTSVGYHDTRVRWSGNDNYYASDWSNSVRVRMYPGYLPPPTATGATVTYGSTAYAFASGGGGYGSLEWSNGSSRSATGYLDTSARWSGNSNYYASNWSNSVRLTVNKADPTITATPTDRGGTYTGYALNLLQGGSANISGSFSYSTATNAGTYTATWTFTPTDTTNYNSVSGTVTAHIYLADPGITASPSAKSGLVYNGSSLQLINAGTVGTTPGHFEYRTNASGSWSSYSTTIPAATNAGNYSYYWIFYPNDSTNYYSVLGGGINTLSIAKKQATISWTASPSSVDVGSSVYIDIDTDGDGIVTFKAYPSGLVTISNQYITGVSPGTCTITATISEGTNYYAASTSYSLTVTSSYVDLGLPSGNLWANRYVGASSEIESGYGFSYGSIEPNVEKYLEIYDIKGNPNYDAATYYLGSAWHIPDQSECQELISNTTYRYVGWWDEPYSGQATGGLFTSNINGKTLFLQATRYPVIWTSTRTTQWPIAFMGDMNTSAYFTDDTANTLKNIIGVRKK